MTGIIRWEKKTGRKVKIGKEAGSHSHGYRRIMVCGHFVFAHRIAFAFMTGRWPSDQIDHINRNRLDNRWSNLREANHSQQQQNSNHVPKGISGIRNVYWDNRMNKWFVAIGIEGCRKYIASFDDKTEAAAVAKSERAKHHGEFFNHEV